MSGLSAAKLEAAHGATNYERWYKTKNPFQVLYELFFEPSRSKLFELAAEAILAKLCVLILCFNFKSISKQDAEYIILYKIHIFFLYLVGLVTRNNNCLVTW